MALFGRRAKPPAELVAVLDKDERVLSWADTRDGAVVAATPRGLWWPDPAGLRLMLWQHVDKAVWRDNVLTVVEAEVVDDLLLIDRPPVWTVLETPRDLPPTVRKRVEGNIVRSELVTVAGGAVRFVARRRPGQDGVAWWAHLEPGTRDTAALREAVRKRIEILQSSD